MQKLEICAVKVQNKLNQIFPSSKRRWFCSAIITAAGSGQRMGGVSKQLLLINDKPCIAYSLLAFQNCAEINEIIVTAKKEEVEKIRQICTSYRIDKLKDIVIGGSTRQESVSAGFHAISANSDIVAIHDAARPLIRANDILKLIDYTKRYGAVTAANLMVDTVKRGNDKEISLETVSRENLYTVQTPQVFLSDLYRVSLAMASRDSFVATDDTSLAEHAGFPVKLCKVAPINIKLTTADDIKIVSALLKERKDV